MRHQKGSVYERSKSFYVRYYGRDESGKPVQLSKFLARKDDVHYSTGCKAVQKLKNAIMDKVNAGKLATSQVLVTDYWDQTYLPHLKEKCKPSTVAGYEQMWSSVLKDHFTGRYLADYDTVEGTNFLDSLTKKKLANKEGYAIRTINHIRFLASGLFGHAVATTRLVTVNPWNDVMITKEARKPVDREAYSVPEALAMIDALKDHPDSALIIGLSCLAGLDQGEITGLKYDDIRDGVIHVTRNVVRGIEGTLKAEGRRRDVPVIPQLAALLQTWWIKSGRPKTGWVFPNRKGTRPINLRDRARNVIKPILAKAGLTYRGYHAGRHTVGTALTAVTGNALAAQFALGHSNLSTTENFYLDKTQKVLTDGMVKFAAAVDAAGKE